MNNLFTNICLTIILKNKSDNLTIYYKSHDRNYNPTIEISKNYKSLGKSNFLKYTHLSNFGFDESEIDNLLLLLNTGSINTNSLQITKDPLLLDDIRDIIIGKNDTAINIKPEQLKIKPKITYDEFKNLQDNEKYLYQFYSHHKAVSPKMKSDNLKFLISIIKNHKSKLVKLEFDIHIAEIIDNDITDVFFKSDPYDEKNVILTIDMDVPHIFKGLLPSIRNLNKIPLTQISPNFKNLFKDFDNTKLFNNLNYDFIKSIPECIETVYNVSLKPKFQQSKLNIIKKYLNESKSLNNISLTENELEILKLDDKLSNLESIPPEYDMIDSKKCININKLLSITNIKNLYEPESKPINIDTCIELLKICSNIK